MPSRLDCLPPEFGHVHTASFVSWMKLFSHSGHGFLPSREGIPYDDTARRSPTSQGKEKVCAILVFANYVRG